MFSISLAYATEAPFSFTFCAECYLRFVPFLGICYTVTMYIVSIQTLRTFWQKHPDAERPLRAWYALAEKASWRSPAEIKATLGNVSFVGHNRVIFNIKGNAYRLIVVVEYQKGRLFIRFVGTHAEYDRIDPATI